ncbi:MAG: YfiR family protein [Planctomycetes bacterium]|nr:YfiR family protein [Planctomycetota bacterium]MBL7044813.1 YfiR family protein [Pirellulaceae bacterium]
MITKRFVLILLMLVGLPVTTGRNAGAQQPPNREYIIKAALLKHFGNPAYVRWPADAIEGEVFHIGVLGNDPFGTDLIRRLERQQTANGNAIRVHLLGDSENSIPPDQELHLLFISKTPQRTLERRLTQARRLTGPILIVGDRQGLAQEGRAAISFYIESNRVRFEVNPRVARNGLRITADLLRLAGRVYQR